jgi:excinuclease ABC subunit A
MDKIVIKGARQHNLKNVNLEIPKNQLVVFTGLSGSGKSSLAFDTIYAEGQRRYVESLSSYARQFLGVMSKPDVDSIEGLSPAISIDQKTTSHNPRSTVGTITEIYDYFRLLFARVGHPHCPKCGREISQQSVDQIVDSLINMITDQLVNEPHVRFLISAPLIRDKKGEYSGLLDNLRSKGFSQVIIDNHIIDIDEDILLIKTNKHSISAIVERFTMDRVTLKDESSLSQIKSRLRQAVEAALELTNGLATASFVFDPGFDFPKKPQKMEHHLFSEHFACPFCNISLGEIEPRIFSFNSPQGACPTCKGLGGLLKIDPGKIIAPDISLSEGAVIPFASILTKDSWFGRLVNTVVDAYGASVKVPYRNLPKNVKEILLYGDDPSRVFTVYGTNRFGRDTSYDTTFEGFVKNLERRYQDTDSEFIRHEIEKFMTKRVCPDCNGKRLKPESLSITIADQNISDITNISISDTLNWVHSLEQDILSDKETQIAKLIIKELINRLDFLISVGLNYLTLSREASTLAGGEAQRIRLASQIGTGLTGVLYILDEPTVGLHQRDNLRLIETLRHLKNLGNSVIVVEHDTDTILAADHIVDFGPKAGNLGGAVVAEGTPEEIKNDPNSLTGKYLSGKKQIKVKTANGVAENWLTVSGCKLHNLKDLTVKFPMGQLTCITGVSGSGKSTLVHDTLYNALRDGLGQPEFTSNDSARYETISGAEKITRLGLIDQSPIGRTPRSNPATYTKIFDLIRQIFANTKDAHLKGFRPGRFSFNVKGGRCEACQGEGQVKIEMQFLPDIYVTCDVCHGKRYNAETLEVMYKGKNIADVLSLTVAEAVDFFHNFGSLSHKIATLNDVGLGYIQLGQPAPTLSGGEAQRVKLAKELSISSYGHCVYLLDEPTTGLHFDDVNKLLAVLYRLVEQNNTVILIEHNLDVIKNAQYIIDLGPEGGEGGGQVVATGTPREIANAAQSYTGQFLKEIL